MPIFEAIFLGFLGSAGLGLKAAKDLGDSGPADPGEASRTWVAQGQASEYRAGAPHQRPLPAGYGQRQINFTEPMPAPVPTSSLSPIPGFETMFLTDDGGVYAPLSGKHYLIEFQANGLGNFGAMIDTGATECVLSHRAADHMGFNRRGLTYDVQVNTANGPAFGAEASIPEVRIGPLYLPYVDALILRDDTQKGTLFGMSFLNLLPGGFSGDAKGLVLYP